MTMGFKFPQENQGKKYLNKIVHGML